MSEAYDLLDVKTIPFSLMLGDHYFSYVVTLPENNDSEPQHLYTYLKDSESTNESHSSYMISANKTDEFLMLSFSGTGVNKKNTSYNSAVITSYLYDSGLDFSAHYAEAEMNVGYKITGLPFESYLSGHYKINTRSFYIVVSETPYYNSFSLEYGGLIEFSVFNLNFNVNYPILTNKDWDHITEFDFGTEKILFNVGIDTDLWW